MYRFILITLFSSALAQITLVGECNMGTITHVEDFDATAFLGTWYQIKRINNQLESGECSTLTIRAADDQGYPFTLADQPYGNLTRVEHTGYIVPEQAAGLLHLNFDNGVALLFVVQATNYEQHAIIFSCTQADTNSQTVYAWQFDRRPILTAAEQAAVDAHIVSNPALANVNWKITNQDNVFCNSAVSMFESHVFYFALMVAAVIFKLNVSY